MIMKIIKISNNLYQGSQPSLRTLIKLKKMGVKNVVDLRSNRLIDKVLEIKERLYCHFLNIRYEKKPSKVDNKLPGFEYYNSLSQDIKKTEGKTFIHCTCGAHRASFAAQAVEIINRKKSINQAIADIFKNNYVDFKQPLSFRVKLKLGIIKKSLFQKSLQSNLEEFNKMFLKDKK